MKKALCLALVGGTLIFAACNKKDSVVTSNPEPTKHNIQTIGVFDHLYYKGRRYYFESIQDCHPISKGNCMEDIVITPSKYHLFVDGVDNAIATNTVPSFFSNPANYSDVIPNDLFGNTVIQMLSSGQGSIKLVHNSDTKAILLGSEAEVVDVENAAFAIPVVAQ